MRSRQRNTTAFWAAVTFGTLMLCSVLLVLVFITGGQLPSFGNGPSWTPAASPTGNAPSAATSGETLRSAQQPFLPSDVVQNVSGGRVNLRQTPGFQNKPAGDVIAVIQAGQTGTVVEGPAEADGLRWWRVRFPAGDGWMAERSNSGKVLLDRGQ